MKQARSHFGQKCRCGHERNRHDWQQTYGQPCRVAGCPCQTFHKPPPKVSKNDFGVKVALLKF